MIASLQHYQKLGERLDVLQGSGFSILQKPQHFCFGTDAVLLAQLTRLKKADLVCDFGSGTGVVSLILAGRRRDINIVALEIQPNMAEMAQRSVFLNQLQSSISILQADFCEAPSLLGTKQFDLVVSNPPYGALGSGLVNPVREKAEARHELRGSLPDWVEAAAKILKPKGRLAIIYRPQRLIELIDVLKKNNLEPKRMILIQPKRDTAPNLVFLESVKGAHSELILERPLIIYEKPGIYSEEVLNLYQGGGRIEGKK